MRPLRTAILGATGAVGQRFVQLLASHPWFELVRLCGSERSAGTTYRDARGWRLPTPIPPEIASQSVRDVTPATDIDVAFSALTAAAAKEIEPEWARAGVPVFSNARSFRMERDVPLLVPEINPEHLDLVRIQHAARGFPESGFIVTNANCSTTFLAMALAPLERSFGLTKVSVVTLQAISGAGYPGLPSMDILGNVVPFISGEEGKIESETKKILGTLKGDAVEPAPMTISASVNRVAVLDGHTEAVSFSLSRKASLEEVRASLAEFRGLPQEQDLPSAPKSPIVVVEGEDRPQPALDLYRENAMAAVVGRLRPCPVLDYKMTVLGHNTIRGAAGGSILNAELAVSRGVLKARS